MIRYFAAVAVAVCLTPSWLSAQSIVLTVQTASAGVHKGPSTGSPVIGTARRGAVLEVTRELGSWVKVSWPAAQDGVGYMHVSMGLVGPIAKPDPRQPAGLTSTRPDRESAPRAAPPTATGVQRPGVVAQPAPVRPVFITPATHALGLGARIGGSTLGFGATGRAWRRDRLGFQLAVSRYEATSAVAPERLTSVQFEPSLLYSLKDRVSDYLWLRPYVGSGANFGRQTLNGTSGTVNFNSVSDTTVGFQAFGGGEMTFAGVPKFALSADVSYHWSQAPFPGVDLGGLGVSVSGHWYVK